MPSSQLSSTGSGPNPLRPLKRHSTRTQRSADLASARDDKNRGGRKDRRRRKEEQGIRMKVLARDKAGMSTSTVIQVETNKIKEVALEVG